MTRTIALGATVVGWDKGSERRLAPFVDKILTEK